MSHSTARTSFAFLMVNLAGIPFLPAVTQADTPPVQYTPSTTTVALLPVINIAKSKHPDKDAQMQANQAKEGNQALRQAFEGRGFKIVDSNLITSAMQTNRVNPADQASWTSDNLAAVGASVHADLVVLMVITDTYQGFRRGFLVLGAQREGKATTKLWLVDVRSRTPVIDCRTAAGKVQETALMGWAFGGMGTGGSSFVLRAIDDATNKNLEAFVKPYPLTGLLSAPVPAAPATQSVAIIAQPVVSARPDATISPPPMIPPFHSLFTFANGAQTIGTMISFDGAVYTVNTPKGMRQFKAAAIKSIQILPVSSPVASMAKH